MTTEAKTTDVAKPEEVSSENRFTFTPRVDIYETEEAFYLEADMPGVPSDGVDVQLEEGTLTLLGRVTPVDHDGYDRVYNEYESGNFERSFRITDNVDPDKIQATLKHGVLTVKLPKREALQPRRIQVQVA